MTTTIAPASGAGILFTQQGIGTTPGYSALDLRRSEVVGPIQEGVYAAGDYMVTQRGAGANMSVDIAAGSGAFAAVQGDSVTGQGLYVVGPHSAAAINETIAAADPSNPRIDIVILEIQDNVHDASGGNLARTRVLSGTATAGATLNNRTNAPALPGNALLLADILVGAGVGSVGNTVIRDRRKWARGAHIRIVRTSNAAAGSDYSTTSTTLVETDVTNLKPRLECSGANMLITLQAVGNHSVASGGVVTSFFVDGAAVGSFTALGFGTSGVANNTEECGFTYNHIPAAGSHLFSVAFRANTAGTATMNAQAALPLCFTIQEMVRQDAANNTATTG